MRQALFLLSISCLLIGCSQQASPEPAAPAATSAVTPPAATPEETPPVKTSPAVAHDVVATVVGRDIRRSDCVSPSSGIRSPEVGVRGLVLALLMDDFSQSQQLSVSQEDIETFWSVLRAAAERSNPNPSQPIPEPVFDEVSTQAKLKEIQAKIHTADTPLLEQIALRGQETSLQQALKSKTARAQIAYMELFTLRRHAALYKKYGGKVVAGQMSFTPVEAFLQLAREAEAAGRLKFHDAALGEVFWKGLNTGLSGQEVPPERVDFSLPMHLLYSAKLPPGTATAPSAPTPSAGDRGLLEHFAGVWQTASSMKPCQWFPDGANFTVQEVTEQVMNGKYLLGREISAPDGEKRLWIMTYDAKQKAYPFWMFNSAGLMGGQWSLTWDAASHIATGRATDTPAGWTSLGTNRFPDANTNIVDVWMKDDKGTLLLDSHAEKVRQPADAAAAILADWSKSEPSADRPKELNVLGRLAGTWEAVVISKPAVWTPKQTETTATWQREWILNERFLLATRTDGNETSQLSLFSYDPQSRDYRYWSFTPDGNPSQARGSWNAAEQSFAFQSEPWDGKTMTMSARLVSDDQHEWQLTVLDDDGTKYLDMAVTTTRRK
jgi:hypothetical protein